MGAALSLRVRTAKPVGPGRHYHRARSLAHFFVKRRYVGGDDHERSAGSPLLCRVCGNLARLDWAELLPFTWRPFDHRGDWAVRSGAHRDRRRECQFDARIAGVPETLPGGYQNKLSKNRVRSRHGGATFIKTRLAAEG